MKIQSFIDVFKGVETNSVLGGISFLSIVQQVLDDIYSDDVFERLKLPSPQAITTAATLVYNWNVIFPTLVDGDGATLIRRIRGLWDPTLSPTGSTRTDYERKPVPYFNQKHIDKRVYDGDVYIDQERKTVTFKNDPLTTTTKWSADLYLDAPIVVETDEIPLLKGWEKKLLLTGCRAWFEELDKGQPGPQAAIFHEMKVKYRDAIERETRLAYTTEDNGIDVHGPQVVPQ